MTFRIYTKTGDSGETGLFGGGRVGKDDARVETYGTVDELNACLGVVAASCHEPQTASDLQKLQAELFTLGAELATPDPDAVKRQVIPVGEDEIGWMERTMDSIDAEVTPLRRFVLPGGDPTAAQLHFARTVCRRAERLVVALARTTPVRPEAVRYLNRLSDLLFMMARRVNHRAGCTEPTWDAPVKKKP